MSKVLSEGTIVDEILNKLEPHERQEAKELQRLISKFSKRIPKAVWNNEELIPLTITFDEKSIIARDKNNHIHIVPVKGNDWIEIASLLKKKRLIEHNLISLLGDCLRIS